MSAVGSLTITGNVSNLPTGSMTIGPLVSSTANAVGESLPVTLSVGANTVTVPSGSTVAVIVGPNGATPQPNPSYGGTLTLKGVTGDTGVRISATEATVLQWDSGTAPASFVIAATVATTVQIWFM